MLLELQAAHNLADGVCRSWIPSRKKFELSSETEPTNMDELLELASRLPSQTRTHAETPTELIPRVNLDLSRRQEKNNSAAAGIFFCRTWSFARGSLGATGDVS
jgi:hypothetical protein